MNGKKTLSSPPDQVATEEPEEFGVKKNEEIGFKKNDAKLGNSNRRTSYGRRGNLVQVVMRVMCMVASAIAIVFMVTARQTSMASFYGFQLQLYSKWSLSNSFEYLVGVSSAAAAYSLLQLLINVARFIRKSPVMPSRNQAWLSIAADELFAYAMMSAGSAALGVNNLNRTGIRHTALPNFCKSLNIFCDHVAVSVVFTLFSFVLLAASAGLDVVRLCEH